MVGVTAEAELKSRFGVAAKVAHGGGSAVVCKHQGFTCTLRRIAGQFIIMKRGTATCSWLLLVDFIDQ